MNIGITNADAKVESFDDFVKGIEREVEAVGHKSFFESFRSLSGVVEKDSDLDTTNKIHQDVENYLSEAMKRDYRLDPNLLNSLANTLDELDEKVDNSQSGLKSLQTTASRTSSSWHYGDILYYGIGNDNAAGETSFTGHTAVMTNTKYYVIEASKTRSSGAKVFHWNRNYLWSGCSGVKQYKVTDWLGNEASNSKNLQQ